MVSLLTAVMAALGPVNAHPQARGPSHAQIRQEGQHIASRSQLREEEMRKAAELAEEDRIALLDPAERARRFSELDAILQRLTGRFRIEGRIQAGVPGTGPSREVQGVADCSAVGGSVGLNCLLHATWPIVEPLMAPGRFALLGPPPASEQLRTMRPAVLLIGRNIDPPGLRAMMVTADTLAFNWVGFLDEEGVNLTRPSRCWTDVRCYRTFQISVKPDNGVPAFVLKAGALTINLTMHPDPDAVPPSH